MAKPNNNSRFDLKKIFSMILVVVGVGLLLYPLFTNQFMNYEQDRLIKEYNEQVQKPLEKTPTKVAKKAAPALKTTTVTPKKPRPRPKPTTAETLAIIEIPRIKVKAAVVKGTRQIDLMKGPGWYKQSALPGEGNTAIAGHRTMYGEPFRRLSSLKNGDSIILQYNGQTLEYSVEKVYTVASNDWEIIKPCGYAALTLTSCHPSGNHGKRVVVRAAFKIEETDPLKPDNLPDIEEPSVQQTSNVPGTDVLPQQTPIINADQTVSRP